jgi:hypothetical protein
VKQFINIPVSPEQEDVILDHVAYGKPLGIQPDEKAWMLSQARKLHPSCRILSADLSIGDAEWNLEIETN